MSSSSFPPDFGEMRLLFSVATLKPIKPVVHCRFLWFKPVRLSNHTTNHLTLVNGAVCLLNCTTCTINSVALDFGVTFLQEAGAAA